MLRGADTYYYYLTNKGKKEKVNISMVNSWAENNVNFLTEALGCLQTINLDDVLDKRLVLGVLDNLRNISLIMLNVSIVNLSERGNALVYLNLENNKNIKNGLIYAKKL